MNIQTQHMKRCYTTDVTSNSGIWGVMSLLLKSSRFVVVCAGNLGSIKAQMC
jgi:hypothetical protein